MVYLIRWRENERTQESRREKKRKRTVDGNGHALGEDEAIRANKGGHLAETVQLLVLRARAGRDSRHNLQLQVVGLGHSQDGRRPRVGLRC